MISPIKLSIKCIISSSIVSGLSAYFFLFIASIITPAISIAQTAPKVEWQKTYGGASEETSGNIIQTADGGYILIGETGSNNGDVVGTHGGGDGWLVKLDRMGNIEWQRCIGGSASEYCFRIVQTFDRGFAVAGQTLSNDGDVHGNHGGYGDYDAWIVKLDSVGNIQWTKCLGGTGSEMAEAIIQSQDGGLVAVGFTNSHDGDFPDNHGGQDGWVAKFDVKGNILWKGCIGGTYGEDLESVIEMRDGGYVLAGITSSIDEGFPNHGGSDALLVRLDSDGSVLWHGLYGGTGDEDARSVIQAKDGGFIFAGSTTSKDGDVSGNHGGSVNLGDAWIVKTDILGKIEWQHCYGGSKDDLANSIIQNRDSGYTFVGRSISNDGDVVGNHGGGDVFTARISASGTILWQKCLGANRIEEGISIIQTELGDYVIAGTTNSIQNGDVTTLHQGGRDSAVQDLWVIELKDVPNEVANSYVDNIFSLWVYPNPALEEANLHLFNSMVVRFVEFYDLLGIQYFPDYKVANNILTIDTHDLPTGSFIVRVAYQNTTRDEIRKFVHVR
ncbi:MAG: T9SS type A sorting domain-containing protein [bacterium]